MSTAVRKKPKATRPKSGSRDLRRRAKELIEVLEPESLPMAVQFLAFLEDQECEAATKELERIPGLVERVRKAERGIAAGKGVDWRKVRQDI